MAHGHLNGWVLNFRGRYVNWWIRAIAEWTVAEKVNIDKLSFGE